MNITTRLKYNAIASLLNRIIILFSGLILPRLILKYYGAETHGLTSSINQFLNIITFLDLGVGAVVQSSLYRPLAENDTSRISAVLMSAKRYFKNISYMLVIYILLLTLTYPIIIDQSLEFLSTAFLIIAMAISIFSQYYYGLVNELLLNADQRAYIQLMAESITVILNLVVSIILIYNGFSIQTVKISTSLIYLIRPIYLKYYVSKHYSIDYKVEFEGEPIKDKWNGMAQHLAYTVTTSTDVVVLSLFSSLENVSIYAVYNMVVSGIQMLVSSLTNNFISFFGSLLANDEITLLNEYFNKIEWLVHTFVIFLFGMTAALIVPFVLVYTAGVENVDYYVPLFSLILVISTSIHSIRTPYQSIILGAGHYKETQNSSIIEATINILVSLVMVNYYGLNGVASGTLLAMTYRTLYLVNYLSKNILHRPVKIFFKQLIIDVVTFTLMIFVGYVIELSPTNFFEWIQGALILGIIFILISLSINIIFYKSETKYYINKFFRIKSK